MHSIFIKIAEVNTISIEAYLATELNSTNIVCENSKLVSMSKWKSMAYKLHVSGLILVDQSSSDLVDLTWPQEERTPQPATEIFFHPLIFAGTFFQPFYSLLIVNQIEFKL